MDRTTRFKFIQELSALGNEGISKTHSVSLSEEVTESCKKETFTVFFIKSARCGYKLQWQQKGEPTLPRLNPFITLVIKGETKNGSSFLTSGYNDDRRMDGGMASKEKVLQFVIFLESRGIVIDF